MSVHTHLQRKGGGEVRERKKRQSAVTQKVARHESRCARTVQHARARAATPRFSSLLPRQPPLSYLIPPSPSPTTDEVPLSKALNSHPPGQRASHWESCWRPVSRRVYPCTCSFVFLKRIIVLFYNLLEPEDGGEVLAAGVSAPRTAPSTLQGHLLGDTAVQTRHPLLDATLESVVLFYAFIHSLIDSLDKV